MRSSELIFFALGFFVTTAFGQGTVLWDEAVNGTSSQEEANQLDFVVQSFPEPVSLSLLLGGLGLLGFRGWRNARSKT
jgi:hypothetical protein